jgi:hypothetical protein
VYKNFRLSRELRQYSEPTVVGFTSLLMFSNAHASRTPALIAVASLRFYRRGPARELV